MKGNGRKALTSQPQVPAQVPLILNAILSAIPPPKSPPRTREPPTTVIVMPAPLPRRVCRLIVSKFAVDQLSQAEIARQLKVDRKTVAAVCRRWRRGANLPTPGRKGILFQQTKFRRLGCFGHLSDILDQW